MKQYTVITKEILSFKGNSKLSDIYTFACLYSTIDYKTGESKYNQETIEKIFGISERTFRDSINRLSRYGIISIKRKHYYPDNQFIRKNYYRINREPANYFIIYDEFFNIDASKELKGFLLLLKAVCLNNTNTYFSKRTYKGGINKSELAELLGIDRKTIIKYLKESIEKDFIKINDDRIIILNENFILRVAINNRASDIRKTIENLCMKHQSEVPVISEKDINKILIHYPLLESEIEVINDSRFTEYNSLRYVLDKRIDKLPDRFDIRYLFKVLNIPYDKEIKIKSFESIKIR